MKKAILYLNQFFGQIGGEEKADYSPVIREGKVGPAIEFSKNLEAEITHTIICGDNYMSSNTEEAIETILDMISDKDVDIFIAGPAFQAGRYGVACGTICEAVKEKMNIPVVTSMHVENPGVEMYKEKMYILEGGDNAGKMRADVASMVKIANKLLNGEEIKSAAEEGYFGKGVRKQVWTEENVPASKRMIDMLLKKIRGEQFQTELVIKLDERIKPAVPLQSLKLAKIAILNSGGIVPVDNPDRIQSASATRWGRYDIASIDSLKAGEYKTIHAGFDPTAADADPNVIMPIDVLKQMENEGVYGTLHPYFYSTVGTGTTQAEAQRMAKEIIPYLIEDGVDGAILVAT